LRDFFFGTPKDLFMAFSREKVAKIPSAQGFLGPFGAKGKSDKDKVKATAFALPFLAFPQGEARKGNG